MTRRGTGGASRPLLLGVEVGGTTLRVAVATSPRCVVARRSLPTPAAKGPDALVDIIARTVDDVLRETGGVVEAAGVGFAGPLDPRTGVVLDSPHLRAFRNVPLKAMLEERLGARVALDNCENVAALAEHRLGAGKGAREMVYVAVGTGIGAGIIHNGRLYHGAHGAAGEVGHMLLMPDGPACACGKRGCWEALVSGPAIARDARERLAKGDASALRQLAGGDPARVTSELVAQAAQSGDTLAREVLARAARYLGMGLANIVTALDPEVVAVGGGVAQLGDVLLAPAFAEARRNMYPFHAQRVRLAASALGDTAGVTGALLLAARAKRAGDSEGALPLRASPSQNAG